MASRQYEWQLKMKSEGNCTICGQQAVTKNHCAKHAKDNSDRSMKCRNKTSRRRKQYLEYQKRKYDEKGRPV